MKVTLRFVLPLLLTLGALAFGATVALQSFNQSWFERDVMLRSELGVAGARESLIQHLRNGDRIRVAATLEALARDERILAALLCTADLEPVAGTALFPPQLTCRELAQPRQGGDRALATAFGEQRVLPDGRAYYFTSLPLRDDDVAVGFVSLQHDSAYAARREGMTRGVTLAALALLALTASITTLLVTRLSWRRWTAELRRFLRVDFTSSRRPEFQPLLRDLRELAGRLSVEAQGGEGSGLWTPDRLRLVLRQHLHGDKVVIVANREPYIHERGEAGPRVVHPASGLVTALEPVMRACSGTWVAHGSGSADRETVDRHDRIAVPPGDPAYTLRRVWLSREEEQGYYYGFANEGLWPLCHVAHARPTFRREDWEHYQRVNRRFAEAVCREVEGDDPIVLVQDYHFAMLPALLRHRLPRANIITFWHIPWPNAQRFGICPWHRELVEGLLGSSIVGFHTQQHCNNFLDAVDLYLEARIDREQHGVVHRGHLALVRPYPISVEWPSRLAGAQPPIEACRSGVRRELGLPPDALLGVGVDRLDYTKGIEDRLLAVGRLLERFPHLQGQFWFAQLAAPSRTIIDRYRELNERVEQVAAEVNRRFGREGYQPILLLRAHHEAEEVFRYYRAADLCYVSSLDDGMNLVAKEFVSARDDERGVLVLSRFTGAARELTEALLVNPYDLDQASSALAAALRMPAEEQGARMAAMRAYLAEHNVYRWAGRMLVDAARLRRRDRLAEALLGGLRPLPDESRTQAPSLDGS